MRIFVRHLHVPLLIVQYYNVQRVLRSIPHMCNHYGSFDPLWKKNCFLKNNLFLFFILFIFLIHYLFLIFFLILNDSFGSRWVFLSHFIFIYIYFSCFYFHLITFFTLADIDHHSYGIVGNIEVVSINSCKQSEIANKVNYVRN